MGVAGARITTAEAVAYKQARPLKRPGPVSWHTVNLRYQAGGAAGGLSLAA